MKYLILFAAFLMNSTVWAITYNCSNPEDQKLEVTIVQNAVKTVVLKADVEESFHSVPSTDRNSIKLSSDLTGKEATLYLAYPFAMAGRCGRCEPSAPPEFFYAKLNKDSMEYNFTCPTKVQN